MLFAGTTYLVALMLAVGPTSEAPSAKVAELFRQGERQRQDRVAYLRKVIPKQKNQDRRLNLEAELRHLKDPSIPVIPEIVGKPAVGKVGWLDCNMRVRAVISSSEALVDVQLPQSVFPSSVARIDRTGAKYLFHFRGFKFGKSAAGDHVFRHVRPPRIFEITEVKGHPTAPTNRLYVVERFSEEDEATRRVSAAIQTACPLELVSSQVSRDVLGTPTVKLVVRNVSNQNVVAYSVVIHCFNRFDEPIKGLDETNRAAGIDQRTIKPGATSGHESHWTLYGRDTTAEVKIVLERVRLADGTDWTPKKGEEVSIVGELAQ